MSKGLKFYTIAWIVLFAVLNILTFALPTFPISLEKYTVDFFVGYGCCMAMIVGQLIIAIIAMKEGTCSKCIGSIPILYALLSLLGASSALAIVCILLAVIPCYVDIILLIVIIALCITAVIISGEITRIDKKIKTKSEFIIGLSAKCEALCARATTETARIECHKVYEAIRYSDPMSHESLYGTEMKIAEQFEAFSGAVCSGDEECMRTSSFEIAALIKERNSQIKLLK